MKIKCRRGIMVEHSPQILASEEKATTKIRYDTIGYDSIQSITIRYVRIQTSNTQACQMKQSNTIKPYQPYTSGIACDTTHAPSSPSTSQPHRKQRIRNTEQNVCVCVCVCVCECVHASVSKSKPQSPTTPARCDSEFVYAHAT